MNSNIVNQIGALTELLSELASNHIYRFKTIDEINAFRTNYINDILQYKVHQESALRNTITNCKAELVEKTNKYQNLIKARETLLKDQLDKGKKYLQTTLDNSNIVSRVFHFIKRMIYQRKDRNLTKILNYELEKPYQNEKYSITKLTNLIQNTEISFDSRIADQVSAKKKEIDRILEVLDENSSLISGAIGEHKALNELSKLNNEYYIINDFKKYFNPPVYNRKEDDRIFSIQVDHIVIGPTGFFIIETKNWSNKSVASLDLFSPVKQIRRSSFALFCYLNDLIRKGYLHSFSSHWGDYKLSIKSLLLMVNASTKEQFQYIKITDLQHLISDITKKEVIFNKDQINEIFRELNS